MIRNLLGRHYGEISYWLRRLLLRKSRISVNKISTASITLIVVGVCVCSALMFASLKEAKQETYPVQDIYLVALKAAEQKCQANSDVSDECNNLRVAYLQDISCQNLAPQNGGRDRCGYWEFTFINNTSYPSLRSIDVEVRYDKSLKQSTQRVESRG